VADPPLEVPLAQALRVFSSMDTNTSTNTPKLSKRDQLQMMRDEIRVRIHLASMEVKQAWDELLPKLESLEHTAEAKLDELVAKVKALRAKV
jgi:hypothetical protein